jgi:hypothetical protein
MKSLGALTLGQSPTETGPSLATPAFVALDALIGRLADAGRHAHRLQTGKNIGTGKSHGRIRQCTDEPIAMLHSAGIIGVARIVRQLGVDNADAAAPYAGSIALNATT